MIAGLETFWHERSARERVLLGAMLALAGTMILWFGIARPLADARAKAEARLAAASEEAGLIAARTAARRGSAPFRGGSPVELVRSSGTAAGFTLARVDGDGAGGVTLAIPSARAPALFAWLARLEAQGLRTATLDLRANSDGTLAVEAVLKR